MKRLLVLATICALTSVWADDKAKQGDKKKPAGEGAMTMPKPAPEARELRDFAGSWKTTDSYEKVEGVFPGGEGTSTQTITLGPGGHSVIMHIKSVTGPMSSFRAVGVLAWNPDEKEYKLAWVENMMPGLAVETGHKQGNDIVLAGEVMMAGKKYKTKDVLSDRTPASYTLTSYMDDGSGEKKMMTVKATKEKEEVKATK